MPTNGIKPFDVFLSYSHRDEALVAMLTELLRAVGLNTFRAKDSISPGTKWRLAITQVLEHCNIVCVFWSVHSSASAEVRKEYLRAIELRKAVVPVLLDETSLTPELAEFQWIDLQPVHSLFASDDDTTRGGGRWRSTGTHAEALQKHFLYSLTRQVQKRLESSKDTTGP